MSILRSLAGAACCALLACKTEPRRAQDAPATPIPASAAQHPEQPVLVELFTSEGCSSCPSAEHVLRDLSRAPPPSARVIALELHVDYWNGLGHVDPFSSARFTARQQDYAVTLGARGTYTPQAVVDGQHELVGSRASDLAAAVTSAAALPHADVSLEGRRMMVGSLPAAARDAHAFAATVLRQATTHVARGENAGLTLEHHWIAKNLVALGAVAQTGGSFEVPPGDIVVWVRNANGHVLGSAASR